jgi:DNA (cytosine-5)-methyltransferase 1
MKLTHGSLFSGIGGFDLAAEWMGWENVFHCEWMPFPRQVLKYHFPNSISYEDITKTDFTIHRGRIDVLTGGFPCQPYSVAGKRLGKDDERHLFPEMLRAIREIEPRFVVGENVRGLVNWNGGMVFEEVQIDLANEGYEVIPFILPACAVGAPHRRDRVWFIAHTKSNRTSARFGEIQEKNGEISQRNNDAKPCDSSDGNASYTNNKGLERFSYRRMAGTMWKKSNQQPARCIRATWQNFPTQSPICGRDDGLPTELDGITFSKWRAESIKGYGNAVVPQVVYEIFQAIEKSLL